MKGAKSADIPNQNINGEPVYLITSLAGLSSERPDITCAMEVEMTDRTKGELIYRKTQRERRQVGGTAVKGETYQLLTVTIKYAIRYVINCPIQT